jgi:amino acid adenylation domain-containing protein
LITGSSAPDGVAHRLELPTELSGRVRAFAEQERVPVAAVVLAAFEILLFRTVAAKEAVFDLAPGAACRDVVARAKEKLAAARPSEQAVDLAFVLDEAATGNIAGHLSCRETAMTAESGARMAARLETLLDAMGRTPSASVSEVTILPDAERRRVLVEWNATAAELPDPRALHEMFEAQAAGCPDRIALELDDARLTYRELDERANDLAHVLRDHGVGPEAIVAVYMDRSLEMVIALYAVLKAGGAYAPFDPQLPPERLAFMARDLGASAIIVKGTSRVTFDAGAVAVLPVDAGAPVTRPSKVPAATADAQLAYVIYTSGSTGTPKAAMNTHGGLRNRILWMQDAYRLEAHDRVLQKTPFSFDVSVWEFFWPLAFGARLVVARPDGHKDPTYLASVIRDAGITTLHFVPSMLQIFLEEPTVGACTSLARVICSGEALPRPLADRFHERLTCELHNLYGPTEASIDVTSWHCERGDPRQIPIGRPIWNTQIYIVDAHDAPCPIGVVGEILLGGAGVGRGYWGRPELTASRFVDDPFSAGPGRRVYRTGDLGRFREDGAIEYVGRIDHQVKLRGFRIELGEIEACLTAQEGVRAATVVVHESVGGDKRLVAYVEPASAEVPALKAALRAKLPDYMVPDLFVTLEALPLTTSGKVDRASLPAPAFEASREAYVAPRDPVESAIASAFADVLGCERVGVSDDFFALGGHSLHAMRVVARLRLELSATVSVRDLSDAPTVELLAGRVRGAASRTSPPRQASLVRATRANARLPLSRLQERLWFLEKLEPNSSAYLLSSSVRLRGNLQVDALQRAFAELVARHEALRTTFEEKGQSVVQVLHQSPPLKWERRDLSRVPANEKDRTLADQTRKEAATPFDLRRGPLFRVKLIKLDEDDHALLMTMHHIVSDGWSLGVIAREIAALYDSFCSGAASSLPEVTLHYGDYAAWERERLGDQELAPQLAYWKTQLGGAPPALELPTDRPRPVVQKHRGAQVSGGVDAKTAERFRQVARQSGATTYMALLTAFSVVLARSSGQRDVVVATPVVNRAHPDAEAMVGFFMNTLAVRVDLSGEPTFVELLGRAREASLGAYANQDVPFDRVVQELNPTRDVSRNPIAQVSLNVLNLPDMRIRLAGTDAQPIVGATGGSKFDLTLYVEERDGLRFELVYDPDLFDEARMSRLVRRVAAVVEHIAVRPTSRIGDVSLVLEEERSVLPDPTAPLPLHEARPITARFDEHVRAAPERRAVSDARRTWTYADLGTRANQLAHWLNGRGIGSGDVVAILAERNALTVWALLAVLKSGAAFMLLDAEYPSARLAEQLRIARPSAWIGAAEVRSRPAELDAFIPAGAPVVDLLDASEPWAALPATSPTAAVDPQARAYVMFTSGTSGGPKAIASSHAPLAHFLGWHATTHGIGSDDRFSAFSGLAHDPFLRDVLTPLSVGASVCIPSQDLLLEPDDLAAWIAKERITICHLTPSLGQVLASARVGSLAALRHVFFGGELLHGELVRSLRKLTPTSRFTGFYGATETPQAMAFYPLPDAAPSIVPIGRGIDGVQVLVLTSSGGLAGVDEDGEICVRTPYLALGYLDGRPGGFGVNPFTRAVDDRVYRTGDRGRYLPDGDVQAMGRLDDQVKVRGFRVELGEVTEAVRSHPGVDHAAVVLDEQRKILVAYFVGAADAAALAQALRERLPGYMIPGSFVKMESIPLTPNGKLDRRALPAPEARTGTTAAEGGSVAETIADIWKSLLDLDAIGVHDNFFDLGGHSLLATQVAVRLREAFAIDLSVRTIFEAPTVAELAERIVTALLDSASPEALAAALADMKSDEDG